MNKLKFFLPLLLISGIAAQDRKAMPPDSVDPGTARIMKEVRHELVMLPYYNVFDNLAYRVDGSKVTLMGQVTRPTLEIRCRKRGEAPGRRDSGG